MRGGFLSNPVPPEVSRQRERDAWELRTRKGKNHQQIADVLGVTRQAVGQILDRVSRRELAHMGPRVQREKAIQSAQLDYLHAEAVEAWEKSKESFKASSKKTKRAVTPARQSATGALLPGTDLEESTQRAESRYGDVRFLSVADQILASKRKLWGMDVAPAPAQGTPNPFERLSDEDLRKRLAQLTQAAQDATSPGGSR